MKQVGYWAPHAGGFSLERALPRPQDHVDPSWSKAERNGVLSFLMIAGRLHDTEYGCSTCRICGRENGNKTFSDGVYMWPEGFAHYLSEHGVKPPQEFIQHALRRLGTR